MKKILAAFLLFLTTQSVALAQITNPGIKELGNRADEARSGNLFVTYFLSIWNAIITVGALAVLVYFLWAAINWITAGGDKGKMEEARSRMLNAFIGMFLLVAAYTIIGFVSALLFGEDFNILKPTIITNP